LEWHDDFEPLLIQVCIMRRGLVLLLVLVFFLYPCGVMARSTNASITGRVADPRQHREP